MRPPREPLFLARQNYRRRRVADAARLLPVVGALLFLLPILGASGGATSTARGGIYVFSVWAGLIILAWVLSRGLTAPAPDSEPDNDPKGRH